MRKNSVIKIGLIAKRSVRHAEIYVLEGRQRLQLFHKNVQRLLGHIYEILFWVNIGKDINLAFPVPNKAMQWEAKKFDFWVFAWSSII